MAQKLFIGGLSFTTTEEQLRTAFAEVGQVDSATIVMDRDTGRSRGFGFVEMSTPEEADQAIAKFNNREFGGRQLKVEKAAPSGSRPRTGGFGGGASRGGRW